MLYSAMLRETKVMEFARALSESEAKRLAEKQLAGFTLTLTLTLASQPLLRLSAQC